MLQTTSLKLMIQRGEVCKCLRAKNLFYDTGSWQPQENNPHMRCIGKNGLLVCADAGIAGPDGKIAPSRMATARAGRVAAKRRNVDISLTV